MFGYCKCWIFIIKDVENMVKRLKKKIIFVDYNVNEFDMFFEFRNFGVIDISLYLFFLFGIFC